MVTANLVVAAALAGLIWTIQVVHYPLFALVGAAEWDAYAAAHGRRITWLVAPLMLANVGLGVALLLDDATPLRALNAALAAAIFAATGVVYSRMHATLAGEAAIARLVRANWWRTAGWTAQLAVAVALV